MSCDSPMEKGADRQARLQETAPRANYSLMIASASRTTPGVSRSRSARSRAPIRIARIRSTRSHSSLSPVGQRWLQTI